MGFNHVSFSSFKSICLFVVFFVLLSTSSAQNERCPFDLLYHFGDGVFDIGNTIVIKPYGPSLPPASLPYGQTDPGRPTGRWCDGNLEVDHLADELGFPKLTAYLAEDTSTANCIMFAVARSPVLPRPFFTTRNIRIAPFAAPLHVQMSWFKKYLNTICITPEDCADKLDNAIIILGDVEANDITYALIQGKSLAEVETYIPYITEAQINVARELIALGATNLAIPGSAPMGCYPFILTELASNNTADYDDIGCLKTVNDLILLKNNDLQRAVSDLNEEFPDHFIINAEYYNGVYSIVRESALSNSSRSKNTLKACCGTGGKYNYNSHKFCGSPGVPVCTNTTEYIFWDGIHLTHEGTRLFGEIIEAGTLAVLNCTAVSQSSQLWAGI